MTTLELILTIIQLLSGLAVTVIVLMQSGKSAGLSGAIAGGAETFLSKGKAKTLDAKLAKATKWFGLVFVVLTLVLTGIFGGCSFSCKAQSVISPDIPHGCRR